MSAPATVPMDPAELARRAIAITGSTAWRAKLARLLGQHRTTVERWHKTGQVPDGLEWSLLGLEAHPDKVARALSGQKADTDATDDPGL